jgi:hypothetical protein
MAVATDLNPGTSPLNSLLLAMNMAATQFRLTVDGMSARRHPPRRSSLGPADIGTLDQGCQKCHLAIWDIEHPAELVYRIGFNPLHSRIWSAFMILSPGEVTLAQWRDIYRGTAVTLDEAALAAIERGAAAVAEIAGARMRRFTASIPALENSRRCGLPTAIWKLAAQSGALPCRRGRRADAGCQWRG